MRKFTSFVLAGVFILSLGVAISIARDPGGPAESKKKAGMGITRGAGEKSPLCPISGEAVDFAVKTVTKDGAVYFCCDSCIGKYEKNPDRYAVEVDVQRAVLGKMERIQVGCPVSGRPVDGKTSAQVGGQKVAFCCKDCIAKYEKQPAAFKAKLEGGYTYQTQCPVSGERIDPTAFTDLSTGQRIYFCCKECIGKLLKDPAKYAQKLADQGVQIDPKKLTDGAGADKSKKTHHNEHEGHKH